MGNTTFAKSNALTQKVWSAQLMKEAMKDVFLSKFMGTSADSIIQTKTELEKGKGDKITVGLRMRPTGAGQSSQTAITLEGNEEALTFYDFAVELTEYGHAVRAGSKLDLKRPAFDLRTEMKDALKEWLADKIETLLITALSASPTTHRLKDKTASGSGNLSVANIQLLKRQAMLASPKIRPVKIEGGEYYVMLAHPYAIKTLKADTDWKNSQLYANIRGKDNPIFNGALGMIDGVVIHEYDRSTLLTTAGEARCLLLGAQAGLCAWGQMPSWYEKMFDYERIPGVATDFMGGFAKTVFNSEDYGVMAMDVSYTAD